MRRMRVALLAVLCLALTGCDLMPVEESFRTAPLIREYQREEFSLAVCTRGDLSLTQTITCIYVPVRSESMKFSISGVSYDEVYVTAGDIVKKDQLLAQLDLSDIEQQIETHRLNIEKITVQLQHLEQDRALALKRTSIQNETADPETRKKALDAATERYDARREDLEDSLSIARLRLADYERQLSERQLRAPMDGVVTYVRRIARGDVSDASERVLTVADSTMSLFRAETPLWDRFEPGQVVTITSSRVDYEAVVTSEEALGLKPKEKVPGEKAFVYFALTEPTFELEDNDRGQLVIELDSRHDVLRVPASAVSTINGETVVYYQDDEGMKAYKKVTVGLEAKELIEVISGLEEGDLVIAK